MTALDYIRLAWEILSPILMAVIVYYLREMQKLKEDLAKQNTEFINQKFTIVATEILSPVKELRSVVEGQRERLVRGDGIFDQHEELIRTIDTRTQVQDEKNKTWTREHFATINDLRIVANSLNRIEIALAHLEAKTERNA